MSDQVFHGKLWLDREQWKELGESNQKLWYQERNQFVQHLQSFTSKVQGFVHHTNKLHKEQQSEDPTQHERIATQKSNENMQRYHTLIFEFQHLYPLLNNTFNNNSNLHTHYEVKQ
tara:strand:- start:580 stop:927 length:348 start_codon:yes stop_codon:yes gene_type:complete